VDRYTDDGIADAYAALHDTYQVMMEVLELVRDLQQSTNRLGDAIVAAGLNARDWRSSESRLAQLSDQLPDITLDELITRLAEFSAAHGPDWLHSGPEDIERFKDEVNILCGVTRPLRMVAQRLRMLPVYERSSNPLERALGTATVSTPLDLVAGALRDLEALLPYLMPLTARQWERSGPAQVAPTALHRPARRDEQDDPKNLSPRDEKAFTRLRDYAPSRDSDAPVTPATPADRVKDLTVRVSSWAQAYTRYLPITKWLVVAVAIVSLACGILLLTIATRPVGETSGNTIASQLVASPTQVSLACSGRGATLRLWLRNSGKTLLQWSVKTPGGLVLSATRGTLPPGKSVALQVSLSTSRPEQGIILITASNSSVRIPYTVRCD
jgi:hypothetical protein